MRKIIVSIVLSCLTLSFFPHIAQAQETNPNITEQVTEKNPEHMTTAEIIDELYASEVNSDIYQCAKSSAMILTGEKVPADYYGTLLIGTYDSPDVFYHANISVPVGNTIVQASIGSSYTMVLPSMSAPDADMAAKNKKALNILYQTIQEAKTETVNMSASEKAVYLVSFVQARLEKKMPVTGRVATCLQNRSADCDGFSGLYYVTAMNCGLNVKTALGRLLNEEHAWNLVELDDAWKMVDPIFGTCFLTDSEMAQQGYLLTH